MSTTNRDTETTVPAAGTADAQPDRDELINARAEVLFTELVKTERRKPPTERATNTALWKQALGTARTEIRRKQIQAKAKQIATETVTSVYADVRSAVHRNRHHFAPWLVSAPYAVTGEAAYLLAAHGGGSPIGISALCAATAAGASLLAWRKKLADRVPTAFRAKVQAGMGMLCGWTAMMPLLHDANQAGMLLALSGGTAFMGLSWWRQHDHPIPLADDIAAFAPEALDLYDAIYSPDAAATVTAAEQAFAEQILADWKTYVTGMGTLPGATLTAPRRIEYGWRFSLNLVRGKQKLADARSVRDNIAAALNIEARNISMDLRTGSDQTNVVMTIITDPITNDYDGPRVIREGGDVYIEIGPYEDGLGSERYHVLADQLSPEEIEAGQRPRGSMNGCFILGTKGSGKSRLMEEIAVGMRKLGIEIWYLDPQGGKSSPALMAEADWPLAGLHGADGVYSNLVDLWKAVKAACEVREAEGGSTEQGFQHTRQRPAIMIWIDECHQAFQAENPETGNSFGQDFADLDRIMRKNGLGMGGASQAITQDTFGRGNKAAVLRDGMCAVNVFLMAYGGKNLNLAPGYDDQPCKSLPPNRGYGYNPKGARPHTRWQARYTPDFQPWLAQYPKATLDARIQKRIGPAYTDRHVKFEVNQKAKQAWLDALDACDDASELPAFGEGPAAPSQRTVDALEDLLSPAQKRARARAAAAKAAESAADSEEAEPDSAAGETLTAAEQRVMTAVREQPHNPTSLAALWNVSSQGVGRHMRNLEAKGHLARRDDGFYTVVED